MSLIFIPSISHLVNRHECRLQSGPPAGPCAQCPGVDCLQPVRPPQPTLLQPHCPLETLDQWLVIQDLSSSQLGVQVHPGPFFCASCTQKQNCPAAPRKPTVEIVSASLCSVSIKDSLLGNNPSQVENMPFVRPEMNSCLISLQAHSPLPLKQ